MHARVSIFQGSPDKLEALAGPAPPEVKAMPGFQGGYVLVDRNNGKAMLITLWESEAAMRATTEQANQIRTQIVQDAGGMGAATVELYEVLSEL